ncbi:hypothetical protein V6N11_007811 [Hibiscus sabdariffa]|uniref:Uncharacterized protein n=1 Tax=Hibiscus sabdariffa TaxID=183260 RepID=A0ABR2NJV3_9ROSI
MTVSLTEAMSACTRRRARYREMKSSPRTSQYWRKKPLGRSSMPGDFHGFMSRKAANTSSGVKSVGASLSRATCAGSRAETTVSHLEADGAKEVTGPTEVAEAGTEAVTAEALAGDKEATKGVRE